MLALPSSLPRAQAPERFAGDPLAFLREARAELGDVFVLRERGPILSRTPDCKGVVAVFGAQRQHAVLSDIEAFGMPPSAARQLELPERLAKLNHSLHSMRGEEHASQKRILTAAMDVDAIEVEWEPEDRFGLLAEMRKLARRMASRVLFGDGQDALAERMQTYFHLRREAASPFAETIDRAELLETGRDVDEALRDRKLGGIVGRLAASGALTEDELVGHANILFISATEPIAVALTWTLLILSQLPPQENVDAVLLESLRLLPPNALMVRITTRPVTLCGTELPERCEVLLSPFVAHRDPLRFPDPDTFRPDRWNEARPSSFDYFPFGAGGHSCVGRGLAMQMLRAALTSILARHRVLLDGDQEIDWRVHIQFLPRTDPRVVLAPRGSTREGGRLRGAVAELLDIRASRAVQ